MRKITILIFIVFALFIFYLISWIGQEFSGVINSIKKIWNSATNFIELSFGKIGVDVTGFGWMILLAIIIFLLVGLRNKEK